MQDYLWLQTGVDQSDLEFNIEKLKLEEDEEYIKILKDYNDVVENLQKAWKNNKAYKCLIELKSVISLSLWVKY